MIGNSGNKTERQFSSIPVMQAAYIYQLMKGRKKMENLLYISAIIAALAFLVLVIYVAAVLVAVRRTMNHVANTLGNLEQQMRGITAETEELLNRTNRLAEDITVKTAKLDGIFDGAKEIGATIKDFNTSLKGVAAGFQKVSPANNEKAAQAVKWGTAVMQAWKKRKQ